jgi:hypothetical protein
VRQQVSELHPHGLKGSVLVYAPSAPDLYILVASPDALANLPPDYRNPAKPTLVTISRQQSGFVGRGRHAYFGTLVL